MDIRYFLLRVGVFQCLDIQAADHGRSADLLRRVGQLRRTEHQDQRVASRGPPARSIYRRPSDRVEYRSENRVICMCPSGIEYKNQRFWHTFGS